MRGREGRRGWKEEEEWAYLCSTVFEVSLPRDPMRVLAPFFRSTNTAAAPVWVCGGGLTCMNIIAFRHSGLETRSYSKC